MWSIVVVGGRAPDELLLPRRRRASSRRLALEGRRELLLGHSRPGQDLVHCRLDVIEGLPRPVLVGTNGEVETDHPAVPLDRQGLAPCQVLGGVIAKVADSDAAIVSVFSTN